MHSISRTVSNTSTVPTFLVVSLPFPGRQSIPRPLILSLLPVLGFSHLKPLYMLFGASGMHDPYLATSISWNLADYTAASWHALSIHCPYITSNQSEEITKKVSFITATKPRKHLGAVGVGVGEKGPF